MKRNLTCIICPKGCSLSAEIVDGQVEVSGFTCPRGKEYATNELLHPVRTVTAAVRVSNRENTMVSVKTAAPVPKDQMMNVMDVIHKLTVQAPVSIGQVLASNICGTDIVATKEIRRSSVSVKSNSV